MARIVLLTGNPLCNNPRAFKEARTLAHAGYEVEILGGWTDPALKARDRVLAAGERFAYTPVVDLTAAGSTKARIARGVAQRAFDWLGLASRWQLGYAAGALGREARRRDADLYIAHSEAGLFTARELHAAGRRVAVDMEDWFSRDLPPTARRHRPIALLEALEAEVLRSASYATCPSKSMSEALAQRYGSGAPEVVYNAFPWKERDRLDSSRKDRVGDDAPSIHWFSQTIGPHRGLEDLFAALAVATFEAQVHLRGQPVAGFDEWMRAVVPAAWRGRVLVHPVVPNDELLSRIAEHDIGFAGETLASDSRDVTVTNKILEYLRAGLAVVASSTRGQREVADMAPGAVTLYPPGDADALAVCLRELLAAPERLRSAKSAALAAAEARFCWERQESTLLRAVSAALRA